MSAPRRRGSESQRIARYRATLGRIPDPIILEIATRLDPDTMHRSDLCVCGWAVRAAIAASAGGSPEGVDPPDAIVRACRLEFGGRSPEWRAVFNGVLDTEAPLIEQAMFARVAAAVRRAE